MKKKCLDEGLAQRLVSFNAKLTNFLKMELWVNLVDRDNWDFFSKVDLAIKSLKFEWNESSIYRVLGLGLVVIW